MTGERSRWYADGLHFECTRCGHCCTGAPGYVWTAPVEQAAIAAHLGLDIAVFRRRYTRLVGSLMSLVEKPNGDCVFLDESGGCSIQPAKPRQCVTFPFWPRHLADRKSWRQVADACPGVGRGRRFCAQEIDELQDRGTQKERICRLMRGAPA